MNNGYSICFNEWALDKEIKNELGLLLIISSLCAEKGYCYASNEYLANLFETNETTISRKIKLLEQKEYITIEYERRGCEIKNRYIRLSKMIIHDYQNKQSTIIKNDKENNISINNININNNDDDNTLVDYLEKNGFILTPIHYEVIQQWEDSELTRYAIQRAVLNGVYKINYVDKILFNYKKNNIKTKEQAIAFTDALEKNKMSKQTFIKTEPEWFNNEQKDSQMTEEEQKEMEELINGLCNDS